MSATDLYFKLPIAFQNLATNFASAKNRKERYSKPFDSMLSEYILRSKWSADQLCAYRDSRLRKMIDHCYRTVPYYKKQFNELGIDPSLIKTIEDLSVLPILTKEVVNKAPEEFISSDYSGKHLLKRHTSGTTGSSFQFVMNREAVIEQWAVTWRYWNSLGISFDEPHAMFGTRRIVPPSQETPPFWREKKFLNEKYFSAFHESQENMMSYFKEIESQGYTWIHGYPSLVVPLASFMLDNNLKLPKLKHVTLAAENLHAFQRNVITEAFNVDPKMHYASTEGVANASQSESGDNYKIDEDYAVLETLALDDGSDSYEIVGTSLTNFAMPLLRWRLKDLCHPGQNESGHRVLLSIDGRSEDYLYLPSGIKIGKLDHVFKDTRNFLEAQIRQNSDYSVEIFVVSAKEKASEDEEMARNELRESGCDLPIEFHYVDSIAKTSGGKLKFVISEVKQN